ncbi:uncharacterized protein LOC143026017 [Oratosquilla oratoria]|uniref:uncharacterized protein LOC143026017 n=1 Tax=Oratosquilla oratoria TaxID=337810 RepID=UPI003F778254
MKITTCPSLRTNWVVLLSQAKQQLMASPKESSTCSLKSLAIPCCNSITFALKIHDQLSPQLYGFLPQRSTHHCLMDLHACLSLTSVVVFLDLKSAFDVANREIILGQLVEFGVQGNLLRWIRGYLSNRISHVLFQGPCSASRE